MGAVIYKIICHLGEQRSETLQTLRRVFDDQYQVVENKDEEANEDRERERFVVPREKEEISAKSVQSPDDTECHYRNKDGNQVKGYSINVTETCDEGDSLNLITNVLVDAVSRADCDFLQPAIKASEEVINEKIETVHADGAYHSVSNEQYCDGKDIDLLVSAIQGKPSRYDLSLDEHGELTVTDLHTHEIIASHKIESRKNQDELKWGIKNEKGKNRYFTKKEIAACLLRKQTAARTQAELNVRNNVEATIFQLGYHYRNDKSRYRGVIKHKIWANVRCLWINFVRILNFIVQVGDNCLQKAKNKLNLYEYLLIFKEATFMIGIIFAVENFCPVSSKNR